MSTISKKTESRLKAWRRRVDDGKKLHESWEKTFRCDELHSKYVGTGQWLEDEDGDRDKYSVNLFFSGIETRKPALIFSTPTYKVRPRPSRVDDQFNTTAYRAKLYQDTINTISSDKRVKILREALLALHEAFFRFGAIEVGLKSDVVDNPRAGKPILVDDETKAKLTGENSKVMREPETVTLEEQPYVRRIPASQVIVSISNKNDTDTNDWIGYWDWVRMEDIQANRFYNESAKKTVKPGSGMADGDATDAEEASKVFSEEEDNMVLIYRVWDQRAKRKIVFAESGNDFLLDEKYTIMPLLFLKFHEILDSWYPLPPTFNWLPQQREINDVREMQRRHRKRMVRKFSILEGQLDTKALDELESGEDGIYVNVPRHDVISPIKDAPLDYAVQYSVPNTKEDFMLVTGVTGEQKGVSEAETATQANIIEGNAKMRDGFSRSVVAAFVAEIASRLLQLIADSASLNFWILTNVDTASPGARKETQDIAEAWKIMRTTEISAAEALNYEVTVEMDSLSPASKSEERENWDSVLQLMTNPPVALHMIASDVLLRKLLSQRGIKAENEVQAIKASMMKVQTFLMAQQYLQSQGILSIADQSSGLPSPSGAPRADPGVAAAMKTQGGQSGNPGNTQDRGSGSTATPSQGQVGEQISSQMGGQ